MPPVNPVSEGATRVGALKVRPKSDERAETIGDSRKLPAASKVNRVHVTYTVPVSGSAVIHSLSLKNGVGVGVPSGRTPSSWMITGSPQVRPASWETLTTIPLAACSSGGVAARLNTRLA